MKSLISVKDPIDPSDRRGVYLIPCSYDKPYIGKTGPSFNMRLDEHVVDIKHNCFRSYALSEHAYKTKHHIFLKDAKILAIKYHFFNRKFKEAIGIVRHPNNLNRDDG